MPESKADSTLNVALVGNPNTGKSTIFNALSGLYQRVGNYPGVTVEKRTATVTIAGKNIELIDLPGTYSLAPKSPDELVSVNVLMGRQPDVGHVDLVVCVLDSNNLQRNLFLLSQVTDLGVPVIAVLNMWDIATRNKLVIDTEKIAGEFGVTTVLAQANRGEGIDELKQTISDQLENHPSLIHFRIQTKLKPRSKQLSNR